MRGIDFTALDPTKPREILDGADDLALAKVLGGTGIPTTTTTTSAASIGG